MRKILFESNAFDQYIYWQTQDKKTLKKINQLLVDIDRSGDGKTGLGHPESLKGNLSGWWSREINFHADNPFGLPHKIIMQATACDCFPNQFLADILRCG